MSTCLLFYFNQNWHGYEPYGVLTHYTFSPANHPFGTFDQNGSINGDTSPFHDINASLLVPSPILVPKSHGTIRRYFFFFCNQTVIILFIMVQLSTPFWFHLSNLSESQTFTSTASTPTDDQQGATVPGTHFLSTVGLQGSTCLELDTLQYKL